MYNYSQVVVKKRDKVETVVKTGNELFCDLLLNIIALICTQILCF